jgi:hypothetical protein
VYPAFIYIGAWMPFHLFSSEVLTLTVWRLVVLALLVLVLRRLPIVLALYRWIPDVKTFREAIFSGMCTLCHVECSLTSIRHNNRSFWPNWCRGYIHQHARCSKPPACTRPPTKSGRAARRKHPTHRRIHGPLQRCCAWLEYTILLPRTARTLGVAHVEPAPECRSGDGPGVGHANETRR